MSVEPAFMINPEDGPHWDTEAWATDEELDLVNGLTAFLQRTNEPESPEVFRTIRDDAHARVVLSRLDSEGLGGEEA